MGGLATLHTNHQQPANTMSKANHWESRYRNQVKNLRKTSQQEDRIGEEHIKQIMGGSVGTTRFTHLDDRRVGMTENHTYTRLYHDQAPCQLCLITSLVATECITHEDHASSLLFSREESQLLAGGLLNANMFERECIYTPAWVWNVGRAGAYVTVRAYICVCMFFFFCPFMCVCL